MLTINKMMTTLIIEKNRIDYDKKINKIKTGLTKNKNKIFNNFSINKKNQKWNHAIIAKNCHISKYNIIIFISKQEKKNKNCIKLNFYWLKNKIKIKISWHLNKKKGKNKKIKSIILISNKLNLLFNFIQSIQIIKHCSIKNNVKQLINKFKNLYFWLNNVVDKHLCYDKLLMHNI